MDKETYNRIKATTGAGIGIIVAYSAIVNSWALASSAIVLGIVILLVAKKRAHEFTIAL